MTPSGSSDTGPELTDWRGWEPPGPRQAVGPVTWLSTPANLSPSSCASRTASCWSTGFPLLSPLSQLIISPQDPDGRRPDGDSEAAPVLAPRGLRGRDPRQHGRGQTVRLQQGLRGPPGLQDHRGPPGEGGEHVQHVRVLAPTLRSAGEHPGHHRPAGPVSSGRSH